MSLLRDDDRPRKVVKGAVLRVGDWTALGEAARAVRLEVFVREQGVPRKLELDDQDGKAVHAVAFDTKGRPIATGRLLADGRIGRMAVLAAHRGTGLGMTILQSLLAMAESRGLARTYLHAQIDAQGFYELAGFAATGERYLEAGIWHQTMERLTPDADGAARPAPEPARQTV